MAKIPKTGTEDKASQAGGAEIASVVVTMGASIASMWLHVRETFYKKTEKNVLKPLFDNKKKEMAALGEKVAEGIITTEEFKDQHKQIRTAFRENWEANIEKMGYYILDRPSHKG